MRATHQVAHNVQFIRHTLHIDLRHTHALTAHALLAVSCNIASTTDMDVDGAAVVLSPCARVQ